jgi:hypothetical protein
MFHRETSPKAPREAANLEARLGALGRYLDAGGYTGDGLCVLGVDGGFVVDGLKRAGRAMAGRLAQQGEQLTAADLAALLAPRRGAS